LKKVQLELPSIPTNHRRCSVEATENRCRRLYYFILNLLTTTTTTTTLATNVHQNGKEKAGKEK
jgi:hypothetical protein